MLLLALAVLASNARAAECRSGEQLTGVVKQLDLKVSNVVTVKDGCLVDELLEIAGAADLTLACESADCPLPPMSVRDSMLTVVGGRMDERADVVYSDQYLGRQGMFWGGAAIYAENSDLTVEDVDFDGLTDDSPAVFGVDSSVDVLGGEFTGLAGGGISALALDAEIEVTVTGAYFEDVAKVGVEANDTMAGRGAGVSRLLVDGATFVAMDTVLGDISAVVDKFEHSGTIHYGSHSRGNGVVEARAESTTVTEADFIDTSATGSGTLWVEAGTSLNIVGGRFTPATGNAYALKVFDVTDTTIVGGVWQPQDRTVILSETVSISSVRFRLPSTTNVVSVLESEGAVVTFRANSVCAEGPLPGVSEGLFLLNASAAGFYDNVFQDIQTPRQALFFAGGGTVATSDLRFSDNTFVEVTAEALVAGDVGELGFINNLVYQSTPRVELTEAPTNLTVGYNLWYAPALERLLPDGWTEGDLFDAEPTFAEGYVPGCPEPAEEGEEEAVGPAPAKGSPVIDAGSEDVAESPDGTRSDIGAIDFDHGSDPGGDTGLEDDTDTGLTPDCDEGDASCLDAPTDIQYGGGCAFGGFGAAAAPLLGVWRRRRPRAAMRG